MMTVSYLGTEYDVPARDTGGMVDILARTPDRATTIAALIEQDMLRQVMQASEPDPGTGEVAWTPTGKPEIGDDGLPVSGLGVDISWIGPVVLTPAVIDGDGNEVTPAVFDTHDHVNIRLSGYALERESAVTPGEQQWIETLVLWAQYGEPDPVRNKNEIGQVWTTVSLVEPDTISTPVNVWL